MVQHGSVFQRRKGPGRPWTARWRENGEHKSKGGFPDEEAAWRFLRERLYELDTGIAIAPSDITVAQYVRMFIERKRDITQNTRKVYLLRLRMQIEPHIGDVKIQNLEPLAIDLWISKLVNAGLSSTTIHIAHHVLRAALEDAVHASIIRTNPAKSPVVNLPGHDRPESLYLTEEEVARLLTTLVGHRFEALYRFLLASQLRIGEALGLTWSLTDLDRRQVAVRQQWNSQQRAFTDVKSKRSRRNVSLDEETVALLRRHRDQMQFVRNASILPWQDNDLVFHNDRGENLSPVTVAKTLKRVCEEAGITVISPHVLRHTGATLLLRAGVPLHVVSRRLGHSSINVTANIYAHVLPSQEGDAADRLGQLLNRHAV